MACLLSSYGVSGSTVTSAIGGAASSWVQSGTPNQRRYGIITLVHSPGATSFTATACQYEMFIVCARVAFPIELGSDFTVELSAGSY